MSDENKSNDDGRDDRKNGDFKSRPSPWVIWIVIIGLITALVSFQRVDTKVETLTYTKFVNAVDAGLIEQGVINYSPQSSDLRVIEGK